ncbi:MAG: L,D-transpeptidase [Solirubrobacterales bacterium]
MFALACALLFGAAAVQAASVSGEPSIEPLQKTVALLGKTGVRGRPGARSRVVAYVKRERPITGATTVLPVIAVKTSGGRGWLRVRLPGRVLGRKAPPRTGWISTTRTRRSSTTWHLVVDISSREVYVYRDGKRTRTYSAIVGAPSTPTPHGKFFVEENVKMPANAAGAPYALALSARSSVFQEFEGGPGQVALHGLENVGGELGTAVSHGCVRLPNTGVRWLAQRIGQGVPVTVVD